MFTNYMFVSFIREKQGEVERNASTATATVASTGDEME
jgi:hypothetical protein